MLAKSSIWTLLIAYLLDNMVKFGVLALITCSLAGSEALCVDGWLLSFDCSILGWTGTAGLGNSESPLSNFY